jgi:hypothetical protein
VNLFSLCYDFFVSKEVSTRSPVFNSKEEVMKKIFSQNRREIFVAQYPLLEREEIDEKLDEMIPVVEAAKVLDYIPVLLEGDLRKAHGEKKSDL